AFFYIRLVPQSQIIFGSHSCHICSNQHGLIWKHGLNSCRQCFCQYAKDISFIKLV
uniref:Small ribosomal subunit protein uS14 n=1 Tax=Castor canadensis TaxID=51338 RepID=A0A8C0XWJ2_CASCN